jgi:hypothetical protein
MKTYMKVSFNSEGARPSEIVSRLHMIGFRVTSGNYDFVYEWDRKASVEDALFLADKVHEVLRGMNVIFKLETQNVQGSSDMD